MPKHVITKLQKTKDKAEILKLVREKWRFTQGRRVWMTLGIWTEFTEARRTWHNIFSSAEVKELSYEFCIWQNYPLEMKRGGNTHSDKGKRKGLRAATLLCKEGIPLNRKSGKSLGPAGREREELKKQISGSRYFGALSQQVRMAALKLPCREPHEDAKMKQGEFQYSLSACYSYLLRMGGAVILDSLTSSADPWKRRSRGQRCPWWLWRSSCELLPTGAEDSVLPLLGTEFHQQLGGAERRTLHSHWGCSSAKRTQLSCAWIPDSQELWGNKWMLA